MPSNPISVKMIDHVVLRVRDMKAAIAFYQDVLGCPMEKVQETIGLCQLRAGASLIDLVDIAGQLGREYPSAPFRDGPNMDHVCLQIEPWDANAITAFLREHGVEVGDVAERYGARGDGPSLYIEDPDGNTVELKGPPDSAG